MSQQKHRVLLIEDNPGDRELMCRALSKAECGFDVSTAASLQEGLRALKEGHWDVLLSDLSLPDSFGLETVRQLRRAAASMPILVLTSLASDETALKALDEGAQDYLVKDRVSPEMLQHAIRYAIQRQRNSEMRRLIDKLRANERLLEKKNKRLEELYNTAHRFVDNVSHEFRTPLTVVKEYAALLREEIIGELNEEQRRMLDVMSDRVDDLGNMVEDMLDISKLEAGALGLWRRRCTVSEVLDHIRSNLEKKSNMKAVQLDFEIPRELPAVYCDGEKLGRVVVNLTTNAIKFSGDPGAVRVWAEVNPLRHEVRIGVTDNGPGIGEESRQAIFKRFRQLGENPRGSTKGFGLGLNIAKELVDLNLGELGLESELGHGSTFYFSVPIDEPLEVARRYVERIEALNREDAVISLVALEASGGESPRATGDVEGLLRQIVRRHDLLLRVEPTVWLLLLPVAHEETEKFCETVIVKRGEANRNRPSGPLPELVLENRGEWRLSGGAESLFEQLESAFAATRPI